MESFYTDLHIHIGRTNTGRPVKITGAQSLTLENIIREATEVKGLHMIGIIDLHVPEVIAEFEDLIERGVVTPINGGGLQFKQALVIPGSEIEIYDENCQGAIHLLVYFPDLEHMKMFSLWLSKHMKNITLSSQRFYGTGVAIQEKVKELGGIFIPAHVFTPHKGLYGTGVQKSLTEILNPELIDGVELGLSANTDMADQIPELHHYSFVSNSDAHSLPKIAREYQKIKMKHPSFQELQKALHGEEGRAVTTNYGLDPRLGKYHRTMCEGCYRVLAHGEDLTQCPHCGHKRITKGVYDRLLQLSEPSAVYPERPPYIHQVPLEFIPKLGPKTLQKLLAAFGTEMAILHDAKEADLAQIVSAETAAYIIQARQGELSIHFGGGGRYGKVNASR